MTLLDVLQENVVLKECKVVYYTEPQESIDKKISSDISLVNFTDEGLEHYNKILKLPIKQVVNGIIYLYAPKPEFQQEITEFWNLFTCFGPYSWTVNYPNILNQPLPKDDTWREHQKYFMFTDEIWGELKRQLLKLKEHKI